jgi:hypothetical protein
MLGGFSWHGGTAVRTRSASITGWISSSVRLGVAILVFLPRVARGFAPSSTRVLSRPSPSRLCNG